MWSAEVPVEAAQDGHEPTARNAAKPAAKRRRRTGRSAGQGMKRSIHTPRYEAGKNTTNSRIPPTGFSINRLQAIRAGAWRAARCVPSAAGPRRGVQEKLPGWEDYIRDYPETIRRSSVMLSRWPVSRA